MGKPFCRKNNKGQPRWYIYVTYKGYRVRKVAGKTKTEALRYQRKWENRLERDKGASIRDKKIPFDFLCCEYLKWATNNLGKQTLRERVMVARAHLKPFFKCLSKDIGVKEVEAFKATRTHVSPATINNELKVLSCILKFGIEFGYLADMPKIRRLKVPQKQPRFLTTEVIGRVLAAAKLGVRPMLQFLIFTGMRKGEMAHLQWDDIDFDNRLIQIQPKKDWNPKSGKPKKVHLHQQTRHGGTPGGQEGPFAERERSQLVFPGRKGCIGDIRDVLNHVAIAQGSLESPSINCGTHAPRRWSWLALIWPRLRQPWATRTSLPR